MAVTKTYWGPKLLAFSNELGSRALTASERARYQYLWNQFKAEKLGRDNDFH